MPEFESGRAARLAQHIAKERERYDYYATLGVEVPIEAVFTVCHYGIPARPENIAEWAIREHYSESIPVTKPECESAFQKCVANGWLQVVTDDTIRQIREELRNHVVFGPIYGLPKVGQLDFTHAGAELWHQMHQWPGRQVPIEAPVYFNSVQIRTSYYCPTMKAALSTLKTRKEYANENDIVNEPIPIGPWRAEWWRRFRQGFRFDIEENSKFGGRCYCGGESSSLNIDPSKKDMKRLAIILAQNSMTLPEWLMLERHADGLVDPKTMTASGVDYAERYWKVTLTEDEFAIAFDSCMKKGWIQRLDSTVLAEIHSITENDSAFLALPRMARFETEEVYYEPFEATKGILIPIPKPITWSYGESLLNIAGAERFRTVCAEWLGPDLEDELKVEKVKSGRIHYYSESTAGFRNQLFEHLGRGATLGSFKIEPIGPWCVKWWERFPRGFRMELEVYE